ncbi:ANKRD28 [Symbiodinium sp. CCMP2456]|nr:ANKRD28 [Symbiodinium sp. CCMP2456]
MEILLEARPSRKDFVADLKEHFLGSFHPARRVASELVKRRIGLGVDELRRLQEVSGVTAWHHEASFLLSHLSERRFLFKLRMLYELHCRWFSFVTPSLKASCAQRCSVLLAKLYSGWAVMAVFYGSTSLAPGQPDCAPPEALLDKIVSSAVVAWISATFGSLPFVVLLSVLHRGRDGTSTMRANIFWGYMAIHTVFCAMVVSIFLASVGPADGEKFLISSLSDLLTTLLITPGLMTVLFGACLLVRADDLDLLDWEQEDLFDVSIASFEVPLQDLQTALKLDSGLFVTVVAEVFGDHASAVELKRDSVSRFSSMEAILVAKSQTLLFTVVLDEIQRMSARTLHAVISGGDVATGYSGSVPLFAAGTSSPCEVFVQVTTKGDEAERPDTIPESNGPEGSKDVIIGVSFLEKMLASEEKGPHSQPVPLRTAAEASIPLEPMNRETPPPEATPHPKRKSQMSSDSCAAEAEASIPLEPMRSQPQLHEPTPVHPKQRSQMSSDSCAAEAEASIPLEPMRSQPQLHEPTPARPKRRSQMSSDSCAAEAEASIPLEPMRSQPQLHEPTPARPKRRSQMGPSLYPQARTSQCSGSQSLQSGEVS